MPRSRSRNRDRKRSKGRRHRGSFPQPAAATTAAVAPIGPLAYYLVVYIDLLGQSDQLEAIRRIPTTDTEREAAARAIMESASSVYKIRTWLGDMLTNLERIRPATMEGMPPAVRDSFLRFRSVRFNQVGFSDTFVVGVPLLEQGQPEGAARAATAVWGALKCVSGISLVALSQRIPLRGGLAVGTGVELFGKEVYGPALVDAYRIESKSAEYPRVVVDQSLFDYLAYLEQLPTGSFNTAAAERARECRQLVCNAPDDGLPMLHFLSSAITSLPTSRGTFEELREPASTWVHEQVERFAREGNTKLQERYARLERYFDTYARGPSATA